MVCRRPEELCPGGDRAFVVAKKRGNARGAKGDRKVETLNKSMKEKKHRKCPMDSVWCRAKNKYANLRL